MFVVATLLGIVALAIGAVWVRWRRRRRDREDWIALAARHPATDEVLHGRSFGYPHAGGLATIGRTGFRAQPREDLVPIEVQWENVRSVRAGRAGGVEARLKEGVVMLPGAASAAIAEIIAERTQSRQLA